MCLKTCFGARRIILHFAVSGAVHCPCGNSRRWGVRELPAIVSGGPGRFFWMWVAAFFGMMTNFSENVPSIYFQKKRTHTANGPAVQCTICKTRTGGKKRLQNHRKNTGGALFCFAFSLFSASEIWDRSTRSLPTLKAFEIKGAFGRSNCSAWICTR